MAEAKAKYHHQTPVLSACEAYGACLVSVRVSGDFPTSPVSLEREAPDHSNCGSDGLLVKPSRVKASHMMLSLNQVLPWLRELEALRRALAV
jgi:hypothetical protein